VAGGARVLDCRDRRVTRVLGYITRDLSQRVPLVLAAQVAGLEPRYFSKRFHKTMGLSFSAWNVRIRVEEAKRLLEIDDLSITAIAMAVGYRDVTTFERAFWRCEHLCPREYRRLLPNTRG
jgi:transcriptional regulator GlxA family with amidase domain